ncbi:hypothetical protein MYAM1_000564 [Malassezia yamatoensis]|uniref:DNA-directed RNA polymerase III subunit RPC5 n=1 Tax=Malassezia yamatoensis TaxID=253288 RepID=A0AAJ6CFK6_9BASI|nr:hypothetical protein MYAM1_000564 [Malassezia yamatoensis]
MEDDELVATLPVFLNHAPAGESRESSRSGVRLELFQYPLYPRDHPLPVPVSAAERGQSIASRLRPRSNRVEMDLPLDVRTSVFNSEKGGEYAEATERLDQIPVPGEVKQERSMQDSPRFDRIRLESFDVPNAAEYMICTVKDGELHLTPLDAVLQLRPSMQHVDMLSQAEANERQGRAPVSDDEQETQSMQDKRPGIVPLNVSLRTDAMRSGADSYRSSRDAQDSEAERWVNLRWVDEHASDMRKLTEQHLLAHSRAALHCDHRVKDFF